MGYPGKRWESLPDENLVMLNSNGATHTLPGGQVVKEQHKYSELLPVVHFYSVVNNVNSIFVFQ